MIWVLTVAWLPVDAELEAWLTSTLERTLRVGTLLTTASIVVQAFINILKKKSTEIITDNPSHSLIFSTEIYQADNWHSWQSWCHILSNSHSTTKLLVLSVHNSPSQCLWSADNLYPGWHSHTLLPFLLMHISSQSPFLFLQGSITKWHTQSFNKTYNIVNSKDLFNIKFAATKL